MFTNPTVSQDILRMFQDHIFPLVIHKPDKYYNWLNRWGAFKNNSIVSFATSYTSPTRRSASSRLKIIISGQIKGHRDWVGASPVLCTSISVFGRFMEVYQEISSSIHLQTFDPELFERIFQLFEIRQITEQDIDNHLAQIKRNLMSNI